MSASTDPGSTSSVLHEIGWGDAEEPGRLGGAAASALMLFVAVVYWGLIWLSSGLAPLAFVASHMRRRPARQGRPTRASDRSRSAWG